MESDDRSCRFVARLSLLSKVGALAGVLEYDEALAAVARLSIPELADWCIVDHLADGEARRNEVAHRDPAAAPLARALRAFPLDHAARRRLPAAEALRTNKPVLIPEFTDELLGRLTDGEYLELARRLRVRSVLVVPVTLSSSAAAITFIMTADSDRRYGPEDVAVAEELVGRAAMVVENARVHEKLRRTEERFRVALAHSNVTVFEQDLDGRYRWIYNPPLGFHPDEVLGRTNDEVIPHEEAAQLELLDRAVLRDGRRVQQEVRITPPDGGETHHLLVSQEPLRDESGAIVGLTGAATDITEQKRVQEQLAQVVAFREQMMGVLGHDLKSPLTAVRTLATLLLERQDLAAGARDCVEAIAAANRRMLEMIGTLLDFTRSRFMGDFPVEPVPTDLHDICRTVVDELLAADPGRSVALALEGDGRGTWDPARMAQVVSNLVANALEHGAPDAPIVVRAGGDEDGAVLEVENDGPPIPRELMAVMFEPFCRGSALRDTAHARGLGLGLFIVSQVVRVHGGTVAVDSRAGGRTRFTVRLPRRATSVASPGAAESWRGGAAAGA